MNWKFRFKDSVICVPGGKETNEETKAINTKTTRKVAFASIESHINRIDIFQI
jgi:hypothetical protein